MDVAGSKFQDQKDGGWSVARLSSAEAALLEVDVLLVKCSPKATRALWGGGLRTGANQTGGLCFHY